MKIRTYRYNVTTVDLWEGVWLSWYEYFNLKKTCCMRIGPGNYRLCANINIGNILRFLLFDRSISGVRWITPCTMGVDLMQPEELRKVRSWDNHFFGLQQPLTGFPNLWSSWSLLWNFPEMNTLSLPMISKGTLSFSFCSIMVSTQHWWTCCGGVKWAFIGKMFPWSYSIISLLTQYTYAYIRWNH